MKKYSIMALAIAIVGMNAVVIAQSGSRSSRAYNSKTDLGAKNYAMGLRSGNQGLVESALMNIANIKMRYPCANFEEVEKVMDSLSVSSNSSSIQNKAYLASTVCHNPAWYAKQIAPNLYDVDEFFTAIAGKMQDRLFGYKQN